MANIAVGDVTYAILKQRKNASSQNSNLVRLSFGNGALTYPAGGFPVSIAKLGCPTNVESLHVVDQGVSGYVFNYDQSAQKMVVLRADYDAVADGALIEASAVAIAAQVIEVEVIGY